jgi:hypothetical protein
MKIRRFFVKILILSLAAFLAGCADEKYPENVVAVVNGKTITAEQVEQELTERKMFIAITNKLYSLESNSLTMKEALIQSLNITEDELNPEQIRYLESRERSTTKILNSNEAFNILLREEVLCQEAAKHGYEASIDEAKRILEESKKVSNETLDGDEEALKKHNEIIRYANEIYMQYGFESEEDYFSQRLDKTVQAITISRMNNQFNRAMADKLPQPDSFQKSIDLSNAWDDYGEFLLNKAKVKVLNTEYSLKLYGKPWSYGVLDLK